MTTTKNTARRLTKAEARELTDAIKSNLESLPDFIYRAMAGRAYKALGYTSVKEWADKEFGLTRSRIYQLAAWKTAEARIREATHLAEEWGMNEGTLRNFTNRHLPALVQEVVVAVEGVEDLDERGLIAKRTVEAKWMAILAQKKAEAEGLESAADGSPAQLDEVFIHRKPEVVVETIAAAPKSEDLFLTKAKHVGQALSRLNSDAKPEDLLTALRDSRRTIDALIADLTGGETK